MRAYLLDTVGVTPCDGRGRGGDLVLDLSAVTFMDARGLSTLLWADHSARRAGRHLRLAAPTAPVIRLLAITHLDLYFDLHLTSETATHARPG